MTSSDPLDPIDPTQEDQKVLALFDSLVEEDMYGGELSDASSTFSDIPHGWGPFLFNSGDTTPTDSELSDATSSLESPPTWEDNDEFDFSGDEDLIDTYGSDADDWYSSSDCENASSTRSSSEQSEDVEGNEVGVAGREAKGNDEDVKRKEVGGKERGNEEDVERKEVGGVGNEEKDTVNGEKTISRAGSEEKVNGQNEIHDDEGASEKGEGGGAGNEEKGSGAGSEEKGTGRRKGKRKIENGSVNSVGEKAEDCCHENARKKERLEPMNGLEGSSRSSPKSRTSAAASAADTESIPEATKIYSKTLSTNGASLDSCSGNGESRLQGEPAVSKAPRAKTKKGKGKVKSESSAGGTSHAAGGHQTGGACETGTGGATEDTNSAPKVKSKRQRLMQLQSSSNDFSVYSAESFLKAKPATHFFSPSNTANSNSNSNGSSSKE